MSGRPHCEQCSIQVCQNRQFNLDYQYFFTMRIAQQRAQQKTSFIRVRGKKRNALIVEVDDHVNEMTKTELIFELDSHFKKSPRSNLI